MNSRDHPNVWMLSRANFRVLTLIVGISALAAFNALYVPLHLERVVHTHPRSIALLDAANADGWLRGSSGNPSPSLVLPLLLLFFFFSSSSPPLLMFFFSFLFFSSSFPSSSSSPLLFLLFFFFGSMSHGTHAGSDQCPCP